MRIPNPKLRPTKLPIILVGVSYLTGNFMFVSVDSVKQNRILSFIKTFSCPIVK